MARKWDSRMNRSGGAGRWLLMAAGLTGLAAAYYQRSYRYRDPVRLLPDTAGLVAPADGTVTLVRWVEGGQVKTPAGQTEFSLESLGLQMEQGWLIGVTPGPLSARYVYAPADGTLRAPVRTERPTTFPLTPGKTAELDLLTLPSEPGWAVILAQAGGRLQARTYFGGGQDIRRGNKLAFLERGGLVLLTCRDDFRPAVTVGEKVVGGQTVLGAPATTTG